MTVMGQTQLTIGAAVALSSIAAIFLSPWAALVTAFFGCGLMMAGVTGRCPLSGLICRMPWNRGQDGSCGVNTK